MTAGGSELRIDMPNVGMRILVNVFLLLSLESQEGTRSSSFSDATCVAFAICVVMHASGDACIRLSMKSMACFTSALVQGRVVSHIRLSENSQ